MEKLRGQKELTIEWLKPGRADDEAILRAHSPEHVARLRISEDFDGDTPYFPQIADFARSSVAAALDALKLARAGETIFSLMRPPGHHATRNHAMGFCYLNSIAIAVLEALATARKPSCSTNLVPRFFPSTNTPATLAPARRMSARTVSIIPLRPRRRARGIAKCSTAHWTS